MLNTVAVMMHVRGFADKIFLLECHSVCRDIYSSSLIESVEDSHQTVIKMIRIPVITFLSLRCVLQCLLCCLFFFGFECCQCYVVCFLSLWFRGI